MTSEAWIGREGAPARQGSTVLLVDDDRGLLEIYRGFLTREHYRVLQAEGADEALDLVRKTPVDVVTADYSMPGMTGVELLRRVREVSPRTVRILFTGVADTRIVEEALNTAEAFRFLVKPLSPESLRIAVAQALDFQRMREENRRFREEMEELVDAQARQLTVAKAFTASLLESLPVGVLAVGPDGMITKANRAAQAILALPEERLVGRPAAEAGAPCRPERCTTESRGNSSCKNREVEVTDHRGLRRTILWSCEAVRDNGAGRSGRVASFIDISEEKELEAKVFHAKQEIEAAFDSITDPTFLVDANYAVLRANRAFSHFVNKPFQDIVGRRCDQVFPPEIADCPACPVDKIIETGEPAHRELRDGSGKVYKAHYFPIVESGRVVSVVVRYQDVTSERELEHRLLQAEKMASIGQLAAGIAHEINNPVGFILSNLNRLAEYAEELNQFGRKAAHITKLVQQSGKEPREAWDEYFRLPTVVDLKFVLEDLSDIVGECREGAERIRKIVLDLKTFSHPDAREWEYADLNRGIESTLNIARNELKYRCEVVTDFGQIPHVLCRPQQMNQVFMNLLVNAAQAIPEKGTVAVRTWSEGETVLVAISDTGVGIAPEVVNRIFDPFFTTKAAGDGTGLGLHLASGIVRAHDGEIRVVSEPGKGSTFTISVPVVPPQAENSARDEAC